MGQNGGSTNMPSSVEIMSIRNASRNTSNEWNEVNYTEELRKDQKFYLSTWPNKSQDRPITMEEIP